MPKLTRSTNTKGILGFVTPWFAADRMAGLLRPSAAERLRPEGAGAAGRTSAPMRRLVAGLGLAVCFAQGAIAQCATQWLPGDGIPGVNGNVYATVVRDPDGPAGPLVPRLVVGGEFTLAGNAVAQNIAEWDPATGNWSPLGTGTGQPVRALAVMPNGDLIAGGNFTTAGGLAANRIARWNGTAWAAIGTGVAAQFGSASVSALHVLNGDLIVGGEFSSAGGVSANRIARWNGSTWAALGSGTNGWVGALTSTPSGQLFVGGFFSAAGGVAANSIARWNGSTWAALGTGVGVNGAVYSLSVLPNGNVVAAGYFASAGGIACNHIAQWSGSAWTALGTGLGGTAMATALLANGDLIAGGDFNSIVRWNGASWSSSPGLGVLAAPAVSTLTVLPGGDLVAGGSFTSAGAVTALSIARWNGSAWSGLSGGVAKYVGALTAMPDGTLVASVGSGGNPMVRWNGSAWSSFSSLSPAYDLAVLRNGTLVAGGPFAAGIASWNGSAWVPLGSGVSGFSSVHVGALAVRSNGDLVAGGGFTTAGSAAANNIARWNGMTWSALGAGLNDHVVSLIENPGGEIIAGGYFTAAGGVAANKIARWNGTTWAPLGSGLGSNAYESVRALAILPNGDLVAGGSFTAAGAITVNNIARWNGAAWSALGSGFNSLVSALIVLPNGDLVAGGNFTASGAVSIHGIARWNGTNWTAIGTGANGSVFDLASMPNGDLAMGGDFTTMNGSVSAYFARLTTTCPATASPIPTTCTGLTGPLTLTADSLPWTGSTFRSHTNGFAPNAIAASLLGFGSPGTPLPLLSPLGLPNCDLLASPDSALLLVPSAGAVSWQFSIPNSVTWAGVPLFHQTLQLEFLPAPGAMALSSSNALALTIGTF